jgi:hypothetical protein
MPTTKNTAAPIPATIEQWLQALIGAFTHTRRPDGTSYWHLSEAAYWQPVHDQLQQICRAAHREEFPNDWRYETTYDIAHALLSWCEADSDPWDMERFEDLAPNVADEIASHSTTQLAGWVSDYATRGFFDDPSLVQGLVCDIPTMLRWRQCEEVQLMALAIVNECEQLCR